MTDTGTVAPHHRLMSTAAGQARQSLTGHEAGWGLTAGCCHEPGHRAGQLEAVE
jgi:hypothetical protein